jgi:hypothetical protein
MGGPPPPPGRFISSRQTEPAYDKLKPLANAVDVRICDLFEEVEG